MFLTRPLEITHSFSKLNPCLAINFVCTEDMADFDLHWNWALKSAQRFSYHHAVMSALHWHWLQGPIDRQCMRSCPPMMALHEWGVINLWSNQRSVTGWLTERSLWGSDEARVKGLPGDQGLWQRDALNSSDSLKWIWWAVLSICLFCPSITAAGQWDWFILPAEVC